MSQQLTSAVPPHLALWHIERLDEQCNEVAPKKDIDLTHGPFGAFRLSNRPVRDIYGNEPLVAPPEQAPDLCTDEQLVDFANEAWSPNTQEGFQMLLDQSWVQWEQLDNVRIEEIADTASLPDVADVAVIIPSFDDERPRDVTTNDITGRASLSRSITPISFAQLDRHQGAWILLKHYLHTVLKSFTPFRHSKTPWHTLFVPLVKNCLAGLVLQEDVDHASLCVFYGTLAISASSLSETSQDQSWLRKHEIYRQRALDHCKSSLESAYDSPKKTKYKSQLMALLTMAQLSIISGCRTDTEYFLIEAEKFIRLRGLNRKKSRKVRLLHHCYAYERIFFESTSMGGTSSLQYARHVRTTIESSGARAYSKDSLSFRLPTLDNLERDMLKVKDQEMGENDLHLQLPGRWPLSQYDEIFGISENYVFLVSLIVRLAKEKDGDLDDGHPNNLSMKSFTTRAKAIEKFIKQQKPSRPSREADLDHIIEATHNAVVIYFYRRIHDVDASILQCNVSQVREALMRYESASSEKGFASLRLLWPALIAACEAEEAEMQTFFANWFERASQQSGLRLFDVTMANVEKVWQEKRTGSGASYWSFVMETV